MSDVQTSPDVHTIHFHKMAVDTILAMGHHVELLGMHYGPDSKEYKDASGSLLRNLVQLTSMFFGNDTTVTKDGELSLFVRTVSGFVYGLIWHGERIRCVNEGCQYYRHNGKDFPYHSQAKSCGDHKWSRADDAPEPGSWSFHS